MELLLVWLIVAPFVAYAPSRVALGLSVPMTMDTIKRRYVMEGGLMLFVFFEIIVTGLAIAGGSVSMSILGFIYAIQVAASVGWLTYGIHVAAARLRAQRIELESRYGSGPAA